MPGKKVLIIDDDQAMVAALKDGLEFIGLEVAVAYDGLQGVLMAHEARPDVVLLDFNLPAGGGAGVYERLRSSLDTCRIPVVFATAVKVEEVQAQIRPGPQTYFLRKPVSLEQMRGVLERILGAPATAAPAPAAGDAPPAAPAPSPRGRASVPSEGDLSSHRSHELLVRVACSDLGPSGTVYYASFFRYFELSRDGLLGSAGVRPGDLERDRKLLLPVVEARCDCLAPSRGGEFLARSRIERLGPASLSFRYEVAEAGSAGRLVARGFTRHAVLGAGWRPVRIPPDLRALLEPLAG